MNLEQKIDLAFTEDVSNVKDLLTCKFVPSKYFQNTDEIITFDFPLCKQVKVIPRLILAHTYDGIGMINIPQNVAWDIEVMKKHIVSNIEKSVRIIPMKKVITNISYGLDISELGMTLDNFNVDLLETEPLFVLTNDSQINGSNVLFAESTFKWLKKTFKEFVLIPSSIHEWLIVNLESCGPISNKSILSMISDVNAACVSQKEYLGDFLLRYEKNSLYEVNEK